MDTQPSGVGRGDRGLQLERTRLAWRRTTLAATVVTLLGVGRVFVQGPRPAGVAGLALAALAWLALVSVAHRRIDALTKLSTSEDKTGVRPADAVRSEARRAPAALALLTTALALLGLLLLG